MSPEAGVEHVAPPAVIDIIRNRVPFEFKGKGGQIIYFETPKYTVNRDIETPATGLPLSDLPGWLWGGARPRCRLQDKA
jgi:hypothetical protein